MERIERGQSMNSKTGDLIGPDLLISKLSTRPQSSQVGKATLQIKQVDGVKTQPDVHLRPELMKPDGMISIKSMSRINTENNDFKFEVQPPSAIILTSSEIEDKNQSSLNKGIIQNIQTLRKYKMGISPKHKSDMLKTQIANSRKESAPNDNVGKPVQIPTLKSRIASSESIGSKMTDTFLDSVPPLDERPPHPHSLCQKEKKIVVKSSPSINLELYQLTSLPATKSTGALDSAAGSNTIVPSVSPFELNTAMMAPSPPRPSTAPSAVAASIKVPMYTASTFRVPSKEVVTTFGGVPTTVTLTTDAIDLKNAYELNRTNSAPDTSPKRNRGKHHPGVPIPQPSPEQRFPHAKKGTDSSDNSVDGDSYLDDRKEVFLQDSIRSVDDDQTERSKNSKSSRPGTTGSLFNAASTSATSTSSRGILHSSRAKSATRSRQVDAFKNPICIDTLQDTSTDRIKITPKHTTNRIGDKPGHGATDPNIIRCAKCFKLAVLWCKQCAHAYCGVCWATVEHHGTAEMATPPATSLVHNFRKPRIPKQGVSKPQPPGSPNSYSKSVVFGAYRGDNDRVAPPSTENKSPVKAPRPDSTVIEYRDYPLPPVFLDGKGNVYHDMAEHSNSEYHSGGRPHSSPQLRCRSPQNRNPVDQSNKYNNGKPIVSNSNLARMSARRREKQSMRDMSGSDDLAHFEMNNFHYITKNKLALLNPLLASTSTTAGATNNTAAGATLSNLEFVRTNPVPIKIYDEDDEPYDVRAKTPAFAAGSGSITVAYSARPSTESRPLTGIAVEFLPEEWKFSEFQEIKKELEGKQGNASPHTGRDHATSRPATSSTRPGTRGNLQKSASTGSSLLNRNHSAGHTSSAAAADLSNRVLETFRGVAVYTRNNTEHEASLKVLEAVLSGTDKQVTHPNKTVYLPGKSDQPVLSGSKSARVVSTVPVEEPDVYRKPKLKYHPVKERKTKSPYEHPLLQPVTPPVIPQFKCRTLKSSN